ncbi:MAG: elongation factor P [Bacteroidetes bacterium]|nr:elongation factor P [Bacteroidota bacterium]MCL5027175.1 elongation factor P [Chloroflexota bacterium]
MIDAGELKRGLAIELDGELYNVVDYTHNKTGRGGALVRLKMRSYRTGAIIERTFSASERFRRVYLEKRKVQFLYRDGDEFHFMDTETFEQFMLPAATVGDNANYLKDGQIVDMLMRDNQALDIELPAAVELEVAQTDPWIRGDTASGGGKPATLETGLRVTVPLFVNTGDVVKVDTRTGQYLERAG